MANPVLIDAIAAVAGPVAAATGLEIWGIDISGSGRAVVRIFVDVPAEKGTGADAETAAGSGTAPVRTGDAARPENLSEKGNGPSVTIEQCEAISRHVGLTLEVEDVMPTAYVLEVSSPGLTRQIFRMDQLERYLGEVIDVSLMEPVAEAGNRKHFRGLLKSVRKDSFILTLCKVTPQDEIEPSEQDVELLWAQCRKVVRQYLFPQPVKPGKAGKGKKHGTA